MAAYIWHSQNLTDAVKALNPVWQGEFSGTATRIITDTRQLKSGDIFLAIEGENFDGHHYLQTAIDQGAVACIVSRAQPIAIAQLIVTDTKLALGQLGAYRRRQHPNLKVIAITGSMGKTSTKEMLGSILSGIAPTLITRGNLNNDLGVPMMLLELEDSHQFAVMELGANHVGEIAYTTHLVKPDVACVLNIGTAHLGEFGGRDNIARTKAEIYQGLQDSGVAIVPFGDDYADTLWQKASQFTANILTFGECKTTFEAAGIDPVDYQSMQMTASDTVLMMGDVFADDVELGNDCQFSLNINLTVDEVDSIEVQLPFAGAHNVNNALAAAACATALGIGIDAIAHGLSCAKPAKGRLNFIEWGQHTLIDDTYNSNPSAVLAAAEVLIEQPTKKVLVLGDIGELGEDSAKEHEALGHQLASLPIDALWVVGDFMAHTATAANQVQPTLARHFADKPSLAQALQQLMASTPCSVLFKGSRYTAMETLIADILASESQ